MANWCCYSSWSISCAPGSPPSSSSSSSSSSLQCIYIYVCVCRCTWSNEKHMYIQPPLLLLLHHSRSNHRNNTSKDVHIPACVQQGFNIHTYIYVWTSSHVFNKFFNICMSTCLLLVPRLKCISTWGRAEPFLFKDREGPMCHTHELKPSFGNHGNGIDFYHILIVDKPTRRASKKVLDIDHYLLKQA